MASKSTRIIPIYRISLLAILYFIVINLKCHESTTISLASPPSPSSLSTNGDDLRRIDNLPEEAANQANNNLTDRFINLSNLNVSLNNSKLKGYKLRELFSKISINGTEPIIQGFTQTKNINDIEVISVDLSDADIPLTLPPTTLDATIKMFAPDISETQMIKFTQNHLTMKGINLKLLNMQLYKENDPKCDVQFIVSNTTVSGRFSFDTQVMLVDVQLKGGYTMQIDEIYVKASTKVIKQNAIDENGPMLKAKDLDLNITSMGRINLNLYNDDDDEDSNKNGNYVFKLMNRVLHKTMKRTYYMFEKEIKRSLEEASRKTLDDELMYLEPYLSPNNSQQEDLVASVRQEMVNSKYLSTRLPNYQHSNRYLGFQTRINFTDGSLSGMNTIKFTGDSKMKIQDLHLLINTSIGWSELVVTYDWRLSLGIKGKVKFIIKEIAFDAVIIKRLFPISKLTIEELKIVKLESVKMDLSGLPGLNTATKSVVNFFMKHMKKRLIETVQPILKTELEKTFQGMRMFDL